jgi:MYXO-CTERM domain-containing protein
VSGLGSGVSAISAGALHACAVKDEGVWCWGFNARGQLGNNSTTNSLVPVAVQFPSVSAADIAATPDDKPLAAQTSRDSGDHRTTYVLAGTAAAALVIVVAGAWAVRRRRSSKSP